MTLEGRIDQWGRTWRGPLIAALVALVAGLPGVFFLPAIDRDESRFAEASAQMLESRDFVTIRFQEEPRFKKPVGIYWLQAAMVKLVSHAEDRAIWAYRLPSLLGAMLAAAACAWGAAAFLRPGASLVAGALLGSTFMLSTEAFLAKTDAVLCGAVTLAMAGLVRLYLAEHGGPRAGRRVRVALWAGLALSILVKGPVGPLVVILTVLGLCAWDRRAGWLGRLGWGWGLIFLALVIGPWAMAVTVATDGAFWGASIGGDLAPKLAGGQEGHGAWPGYHTLLAPLVLFPATVLLPAGLVAGWRHRDEPGVRFALCWLIPAWIVFELTPTKLPHYTLPLFGALAWLMARSAQAPKDRIVRWIGGGLAILAGALLAGAAALVAAKLGGVDAWAWAALDAVLFVAAGVVAAVLILRHDTGRALAFGGALAVAAHAVLAAGLAPSLRPLWLSDRAARVLSRAGINPREGVAAGPVTVAGYAEPSIVFALGSSTELGDADDAASAIGDGRPAVVEQREEAAFRASLAQDDAVATLVGSVAGLDYSKGRTDILRIYRPASDAVPAPPSQEPAR